MHIQAVRDPARSGGGGEESATAAIVGRSGIRPRKGRVPPSVPAGDVIGARAKSEASGKVLGSATSSAGLAPENIRTAAQISEPSKPSCGRPPNLVSKVGDADKSTAVPAQGHLEACDDESARHSPNSDADGVVSQAFSRRCLPSRISVHQHSSNSSAELGTDTATTSAAANPSPKILELRLESGGGDSNDGGDDRANGMGSHCSSNSGRVAFREHGTAGAGISGTGCAGAEHGEVDRDKGDAVEAVSSAPPAVGRRRKPPRSSLLDLACQSMDDI
ncbi:unnamed protein product [Laminaria digitata]